MTKSPVVQAILVDFVKAIQEDQSLNPTVKAAIASAVANATIGNSKAIRHIASLAEPAK